MISRKVKIGLILGLIALQIAPIYLIVRKHFSHGNQISGPDIQGIWEGTLNGPNFEIPISFNIFKTNRLYVITVDSPEQTLSGYCVTEYSYIYPSFRADVQKLDGGYQATLNREVTEMSGTWKTALLSGELLLKRTSANSLKRDSSAEMSYAAKEDSALPGCWKGALNQGDLKLQLKLKITEASIGNFQAELDVVEQGIKGLSATSVTYKQPTVKINFGGIGGTFEGTMNNSSTMIQGTWKQLQSRAPLTFNRADLEVERKLEAEKNYTFTSKDDLQGHWHGTIKIDDATKLSAVLHIAKLPDGTFTGSFDDPQEGLLDIPATSFKYDPPTVHAFWSAMKGDFRAKLHDGKLSGVWQIQGRAPIAAELERN